MHQKKKEIQETSHMKMRNRFEILFHDVDDKQKTFKEASTKQQMSQSA